MLTHHTIEETDEERMEEQANVEEGVPQKKPDYYKYVDYWQIIVKFTELGLCFAGSVLLLQPSFISFQNIIGEIIVEIAMAGGFLSTSVFLIIYYSKEDRHLMEIITLFIYGVLNTISSIFLLIVKWNTDEPFGYLLIVALIAGLIGVIMIADFVRELNRELK